MTSPNLKSGVVVKESEKRDDKMILRNSFKVPKKTSKDLQRDLATAGVNVDSSTVRKRLLEAGRKARSTRKKQLPTVAMQKKTPKMG